ncbi:MAG: hypothetical protein Q9195_008549 [Heterodermia aff. obscurata]
MTSHEWQSGNTYGGITEPAYNAVTYTWGRYELRGNAMPHIKPIRIHGLEWDTPRIDPAHFSVQDFSRLIRTSTTYRSRKVDYRISGYVQGPEIEYLWLDIACIDQVNEKVKLAEIGRQATIFKNAEIVLVWLNRHDTESLAGALQRFEVAWLEIDACDGEKTGQFKPAHEALGIVLRDPWFSSLWTLQEAFLRKDALLLSRQGESVAVGEYSQVDLRWLTMCCYAFYMVSKADLQAYLDESDWADAIQLQNTIHESGLGLIHADNPFTLYTGARYRKTRFAVDRVYGIMQVFDVRLGNIAGGRTDSLLELEDRLGAALMTKWPIRSQYHVHTKPTAFGRGWHISEYSALPEDTDPEPDFETEVYARDVAQCHLSTRRIGDVTWGFFDGKVCRLEDLVAAWKSWSTRYPRMEMPSGRIWMETKETIQSVALDDSHLLHEAPARLQALNKLRIPRDETQHEVCSTLVQMFGDEVVVLGLSQIGGLILVRQWKEGLEYWHRIGICHWNARATDDDFLRHHDDGPWFELQGLFG